MVMDVGLVDVGADDKGVFALGEAHGQLPAHAVCFLWGDLTGDEGLAQMIGDHIVRAAHSASLLNVELFHQGKFRVSDLAIASVAADKLALVGLFWIFHIVYDVADGRVDAPALADVQRHQACGRQRCTSCSVQIFP